MQTVTAQGHVGRIFQCLCTRVLNRLTLLPDNLKNKRISLIKSSTMRASGLEVADRIMKKQKKIPRSQSFRTSSVLNCFCFVPGAALLQDLNPYLLPNSQSRRKTSPGHLVRAIFSSMPIASPRTEQCLEMIMWFES